MADRNQLIDAVKQFVAEEYPDGVLTMYADYRDELSDKQAAEIVESDDPWASFYSEIDEGYDTARDEYLVELENEFNDWCLNNGYDFTIDDLRDEDVYIEEYMAIEPDYDHYLSQEFKCRLILDNGDSNYDFSQNPMQDNDYTIGDGAGIIWLGEQLGYSVEQMQEALNEGINSEEYPIDTAKNPDPFLDSLVHEAANAYGMIALTFLCRMSLEDLISFKQNHTSVTVDLNGINCGFYDAWNGGGSVLELECGKKSITIPYDKIFTLVPDVRINGQYSVDETYGLSGNCYADATVNK